MDDLLSFLLRERPPAIEAADLRSYWSSTRALRERFSLPVDQAVAGGRVSDRAGFAFASGYQAALRALVPSLPTGAISGFSVTEERGNHPRAIEARLETREGGRFLSGKKRWSTMAPLADALVVVATTGRAVEGRPELVAVVVETPAAGLTITEMAPPPFVPEVPHAELTLNDVRIAEDRVLPGDGYADYVKPFRTVEDLHLMAAIAGYLLSAAARGAWPDSMVERLVSLVAAARTIGSLNPRKAETHVALAGLLDHVSELVAVVEPLWASLSDAERERWYRDRVLTQVASKPRQQRRERAFAVLRGEKPT